MSKANEPGPWLAFNKEWFQKHQNWLLFGLNTPGLSTIVRGLLHIRMSDVWMPRGTRIWEIRPNSYTVRLPDGQFRTDFRTHWKYSKRVYYAFKEIWWLMHAWDAALADRWSPALSFGFLTLEVYPDPDPETATVDGFVGRSGTDLTWADIRDGAGTAVNDGAGTTSLIRIDDGEGAPNTFSALYRSIYLFDTSGLGAAATISAAVLSFKGTAKSDSATAIAPNVDIYTSTPASNTALVAADFAQIGTVSQTGSPITYAGYSATAYNAFTFDATGRGNVSKTGVSKFGARNANYDVANIASTGTEFAVHRLSCEHADAAGTTSDPKLVVTYTVPGGGGSGVAPGLHGLSIFRSRGRR